MAELLDGTYSISLYHTVAKEYNFFGFPIKAKVVSKEPYMTEKVEIKNDSYNGVPIKSIPQIKITFMLKAVFRAEVDNGDVLVGVRQHMPGDPSW